MLNKKRLIVLSVFLLAVFGMTMYAGSRGQNETIATRTVKFLDGYNNSEISSQDVEVGKEAKVPESPIYENLVFLGWFDSNDNKITNFASITNDMILTAKYGADINKNGITDTDDKYYDVTFYDTVSRSNIIVDNVLIGMNANPPRTPSHADMVFSGWSRGFSNITGDITVNAVYRRINIEVVPTIYKVTFIDGITKETLGVVDVVEGLTANPPKTNIHSKKAFTNWDLSYENVKENLTITALYADDLNENQIDDSKEPHYTITFLASKNGTLEGTTEFENLLVGSDFDANIKIPKTTKNKGYTFTGWNIELPEEGKKITKSVTYIANFEDKTAPSKVVINNSSNGNWTNETVNIDWESTDEGSGIAKYQYAYSENALDREFQDFSGNEKTQMSRSTERNSKIFIRAVDNVGNKSEATMTEIKIDKTLPKFNHKSGYHIDQDINIIITEQNLDKVVINNRDINKNTTYSESEITLSAEATYLVTAYDKAGNENSVWYAIDKTAPKIDVVNNTAEDSKHFVELNVYDKFLTSLSINDLQIDRKDFIVKGQNEEFYYNIKLTEDNIYKILAKDKFGHLTATEFVIDNSAPSKPVITARDGYLAGTRTNKTVTLDFTTIDNNTSNENIIYQSTTSPGYTDSWKNISNPTIFDKDIYNNVYVRAIDEAGNISEHSNFFQVIVDKTAPTGEINYSERDTNGNVLVTLKTSEEIQEIAGWKKENATTYNKLYTKNEEDTISFKDIAGNNGSIEVKITNINPRVTNISFSTTDPTNLLVTTTLTFSEPVFMPTPGLWLAEKGSNYTKWSTIYYNNIEENITFKNSYGKTNSEAISIKNFDRKLNDAKIEKTVAGDKKSVKVTLTADEEVIVYSNGWQKVDGQDGKVWEKTFTRNTFFGELISYRDVAGNYKLTYVTINEIKGSWTFQEPTTVETTEVAIESTTEELVTE